MKTKHILFTVLVLAIGYLAFLGRAGLLEPDEGRYAEVAREMVGSGDLLIPTLNGFPHLQKPPVLYWTTAVSFLVFGENEIGARMAPLLAALGVLLLTFWIGSRWFDRKTGRTAVWILAGSIEFFILARGLCPDMVMTFWSTAAIAAFVWARTHAKPNRIQFMPFFICMGIAFSTKGPVGILVPLFTAIGWQLAIRPADDQPVRIPWVTGMTLTLLLSISWFMASSIRHPELLTYFVEYEFLDRFFSKVHGRSQPIWFFIPVLIGGWIPWTALVFSAWRKGPLPHRNSDWKAAIPWALFGWMVPAFILLSLSGSKLMTYVLPLFPGFALWLAHGLLSREGKPVSKIAIGAQVVLLSLLALTVLFAVSFPDLLPVTFSLDRWFVPAWLLVLGMAGVACWRLRLGATERRIALVAITTVLVWSTLATQVVHLGSVMGTGASLRPLAERLKQEPGWEQAKIIVVDTRAHGLEFYLKRTVDTTRDHADTVLTPTPEMEARLHNTRMDLRLPEDPNTPCYILTRRREWDRGHYTENEWALLQQEGAFILLRLKRPGKTD